MDMHAHEIDSGPGGTSWELTDHTTRFVGSYRTLQEAVPAAFLDGGTRIQVYTVAAWEGAHDSEGNAPEFVPPSFTITFPDDGYLRRADGSIYGTRS